MGKRSLKISKIFLFFILIENKYRIINYFINKKEDKIK